MQLQSIHLIGVGGAGLSAIATVLLEQGYTVSGSDLHASPTTERLARMGATVYIGHDAANIGDADLIVISSAVPDDNPEAQEARRRGVGVVKRADWLGYMMSGKRGVAIAGTHGKTTTTAMLSLILRDAGLDPTFIVGGDIPQLGTNAAAGTGDVFIIEADEYDHMFLGLRPEVAVVTVVDWDHPDCYPSPQAMMEAFRQFVALVPPEGLIVACGDEPSVQELFARAGRLEGWKVGSQILSGARLEVRKSSNPSLTTYGLKTANGWHASKLRPNTLGGYDFTVEKGDERLGEVSLAIPGTHNVRNALAALVVGDWLGVSLDQAATTLADFNGVGRRFEIKSEVSGVLIVDDYAHHPTEIRATLAAARVRYPDRAIWVVFQPHTYSRTRALLADFAAAFSEADHTIVVDIFPARELDDGSVHSRDIVTQMDHPDARYIGSLEAAADYLIGQLRPGDVLFTMGAGDGYRVGEMVVDRLKNQWTSHMRVV